MGGLSPRAASPSQLKGRRVACPRHRSSSMTYQARRRLVVSTFLDGGVKGPIGHVSWFGRSETQALALRAAQRGGAYGRW